MKNVLHKLYQSEKLLAVTGLLFMLTFGVVYAFGIANDVDTDGDTVADGADQCVGTVVDRPTEDLSINHHIWVGGEYFTVLQPNKQDKDKVQSKFSMRQTRGCSCGDIIAIVGKSTDTSADAKFGCSAGTIEAWTKAK